MSFDLARLKTELATAPTLLPYPTELAIAVVDDLFRMAGLAPVPVALWRAWPGRARGPWHDQLSLLAATLATTSLREQTVRELSPARPAPEVLERFFDSLGPLDTAIVRSNSFRQEELLRKWISAVGGAIAGESDAQSQGRLDRLDYRRTQAEYQRAERARAAEAARRAKLLAEAAAREQEARGWRE